MKLVADYRRGIIRCTNIHDLTQGAIPHFCMWDVCLGELANAALVNAVAHPVDVEHRLLPHPALPQKAGLDKDLLLPHADNNVARKDCCAAPIRMLLTGATTIAPVCPHNIHNNTRRMCEGRRILGVRLLRCFLGFDAASDDGMGDAGCFALTMAPHIAHSNAVHLFSAQVQVLHCQRWREAASMVEGCVSCVHSLFAPCALAGTGCTINHTQAKTGHVGDRRKALLNARKPVALF
jgi:hypothetical protein